MFQVRCYLVFDGRRSRGAELEGRVSLVTDGGSEDVVSTELRRESSFHRVEAGGMCLLN